MLNLTSLKKNHKHPPYQLFLDSPLILNFTQLFNYFFVYDLKRFLKVLTNPFFVLFFIMEVHAIHILLIFLKKLEISGKDFKDIYCLYYLYFVFKNKYDYKVKIKN